MLDLGVIPDSLLPYNFPLLRLWRHEDSVHCRFYNFLNLFLDWIGEAFGT